MINWKISNFQKQSKRCMMYLKSMTLPVRADILVAAQDIAGNKPRSGGIIPA
jgi:hypothetical protein